MTTNQPRIGENEFFHFHNLVFVEPTNSEFGLAGSHIIPNENASPLVPSLENPFGLRNSFNEVFNFDTVEPLNLIRRNDLNAVSDIGELGFLFHCNQVRPSWEIGVMDK